MCCMQQAVAEEGLKEGLSNDKSMLMSYIASEIHLKTQKH